MLSWLKGQIFKQYQIPLIGGLKDVFAHTVFYMTGINFFLISVTAYWTTIMPHMRGYIWPGFRYWMLLVAVVVILILAMLIEYKFILPSYYRFRAGQYSMEDREIRQKLDEVAKSIQELAKRLDRLENGAPESKNRHLR